MVIEKPVLERLLAIAPGLLAALFYGVVSGSMSFFNKIILTSYKFEFPDVVMLTQVVTTSIMLEIGRLTGLCDILPWNLERAKSFAIPSLCFASHTILALSALSELSIPIYNVLRRMLPLASLIMATYILKKPPSRKIHFAIGIIVIGTFTTGFGDLKFQANGYLHALLSVAAQSLYLTYVQKTGVEKHMSALSVLHLNSVNCVLPLLLYTVLNSSLLNTIQFEGFFDSSFCIFFLVNVFMGCVLNYSLFLCITMNSALTTSLVGVGKGVLTTSIGFFTFGGVVPNILTLLGVSMNAFGGVFYTYVKYRENLKLTEKYKLQRHTVNEETNKDFSTVEINKEISVDPEETSLSK